MHPRPYSCPCLVALSRCRKHPPCVPGTPGCLGLPPGFSQAAKGGVCEAARTISPSAEIAPALFQRRERPSKPSRSSRPRGVHRWVRASNRHTLAPRRARTRRRAGARTRVAPGIGSRESACNRDAPVNSDRARYKEGGGPRRSSDRPEHPPTHPSPTPSAPSFNRRSPRIIAGAHGRLGLEWQGSGLEMGLEASPL